MTDGDALLAAILRHPDEDTPRLMYADWLDERGEHARAEHIRWACAYPQNSAVCLCGCIGRTPNPCETCQLFGRELDVIPRRLDGESHYVANRGFVCEVRCTAADWLEHGDAIRAAHPVRAVRLTTPVVATGLPGSFYRHPFLPDSFYRHPFEDWTNVLDVFEELTRKTDERGAPVFVSMSAAWADVFGRRWPGVTFEVPPVTATNACLYDPPDPPATVGPVVTLGPGYHPTATD